MRRLSDALTSSRPGGPGGPGGPLTLSPLSPLSPFSPFGPLSERATRGSESTQLRQRRLFWHAEWFMRAKSRLKKFASYFIIVSSARYLRRRRCASTSATAKLINDFQRAVLVPRDLKNRRKGKMHRRVPGAFINREGVRLPRNIDEIYRLKKTMRRWRLVSFAYHTFLRRGDILLRVTQRGRSMSD